MARRGDLQSRCTRPRKGSLGGRRAQSWTDTWLTYGKSAATSTAQPHATLVRLRSKHQIKAIFGSRRSSESYPKSNRILVDWSPQFKQSSTPLVTMVPIRHREYANLQYLYCRIHYLRVPSSSLTSHQLTPSLQMTTGLMTNTYTDTNLASYPQIDLDHKRNVAVAHNDKPGCTL